MFVLPEMAQLPHKIQPTARPPTRKFSTVSPAHWGLPFYSELPEEGDARTELTESYLLGLVDVVRLFNASLNTVFRNAIEVVVRDEAVEREFIEEDSHLLALNSFIDYTRAEGRKCLEQREEAERLRLVDAFFSSALGMLDRFEFLHRQHVAQQFLDSLFLKRCQVRPGRPPSCAPPRAHKIEAESTVALAPPLVETLAAEERDERHRMMQDFFGDICLMVDVFAAAEKRLLYEAYRLPRGETVRSKLNSLATVIQAAFRGHLERRRCGVAALHSVPSVETDLEEM